nr:WD repeat-containing protein 76-like isoform X2 [Procambarus clarkii]
MTTITRVTSLDRLLLDSSHHYSQLDTIRRCSLTTFRAAVISRMSRAGKKCRCVKQENILKYTVPISDKLSTQRSPKVLEDITDEQLQNKKENILKYMVPTRGTTLGQEVCKVYEDITDKQFQSRKNPMLAGDEDEPLKKKMRNGQNGEIERCVMRGERETSSRSTSMEAKIKIEKLMNDENEETNDENEETNDENEETNVDYEETNDENEEREDSKEKALLDLPQLTSLSEYELMIQRNIAEKQRFFESLKIQEVKDELNKAISQPAKKPSYKGIAKAQESREPVVTRKSLRQQNKSPDGLQLPDKLVEDDVIEGPFRPPPGPAPLIDYYTSQNTKEWNVFLKDLQKMSLDGGGESVWSGSVASVLQTMKKMNITEDRVAKVVPNRVCSAQIHPARDKTLVLAGSKCGELGIWDVERKDKTSGAYYFTPHSRPINCITVDAWNPECIYTTSYDGSLRRTNLTAGLVEQVYCYVDEECYSRYISCHAHVDKNNILVGASHGQVMHIDLRTRTKSPREYLVHKLKSVKAVTVHPTCNQYFATASRDGNVCLWDVRHHRKNLPVTSCSHGRNITGLEFSPLTGNSLISTCMDDNLRFISCDLTNLVVEQKIRHNNQTGRWLTTFKARYVPFREDLVVVGSLLQPRRVEVWGCDGQLKYEFMGEFFGSVASIVALHPTQPILAGCNSSGKVHVFK